MKIDLVYLWVDGDDPKWREKRNRYLPHVEKQKADVQTFCEGRVIDNDELKHSLRSVELYAPWINHIFIVTDGQTPEWLDVNNEKITIVSHNDILPADILPSFNSSAIELGIVNIPNLSEHFLYANDDMMFNKPLTEEFFFTKSGKVICRIKRGSRRYEWFKANILGKKKSDETTCGKKIIKANKIILDDFGINFSHTTLTHNIDAYLKSSMIECMDRYKEEVTSSQSNRFRSEYDLQRHIFTLYAIVTKKGICKSRGLITHNLLKSPFIRMFINVDWLMIPMRFNDCLKRVRSLNPTMFCINDGNGVTNKDRLYARNMLNELFPNKSKFEK